MRKTLYIMIQMLILDCFGFPKPRNDDKGEGKKGRCAGEREGEKKSCGRRQKRGDRRERKKEQRQGLAFKGEGKRSVAGGRREEKKGGGRRGSG